MEVRRLSLILARADLRTVDRESDRRDLRARPEASDLPRDWARLIDAVRRDDRTAARYEAVQGFLQACEQLADPTYSGMSPIDVLLMTRPPSAFDVAYRWTHAKLPLSTLAATTNAIRGTRYPEGVVRQHDATTIDITGSLDRFLGRSPEALVVILGNLQAEEDWIWAAARGTPVMSRKRIWGLGRIVNEAIHQKHRSQHETLLVLPELSLPVRWLRPLAERLIAEGVSLVAGLEYAAVPRGLVNEAVGVFAPGFRAAAVCRWPKGLPAREEARQFALRGLSFVENLTASGLVVNTGFGAISTLICSELLDVRVRSGLLGRIDLLVVPAWNKDTATFDHTIQTTANDLHCYVALANNAEYSDCRVQVPSDKRYLRDACRLICREQDLTIAVKIAIDALRRFQIGSLADPTVTLPGFKPLPPGYEFKRI